MVEHPVVDRLIMMDDVLGICRVEQ